MAVTVEALKILFEDQKESFATQMTKLTEKIDQQTKATNQMHRDLTKQIRNCESTVSTVQAGLGDLELKVDENEEIASRLNSIIVSGIPYHDKENLNEIFKKLAAICGFEVAPECRLSRFKPNKSNVRPIAINFASEFTKDDFLRRYFKIAKTLTLRKLQGIEAPDTRVFLQHDLTNHQYKLNREALRLKREGKIFQVTIRRGRVAVKLTEGGSYKIITSTVDLQESDA